MKINVNITESVNVCGSYMDCSLVSFTATAEGKYFSGKTIGAGVDTQKTDKIGTTLLSARYMLEGVDYSGLKCRVFIENNSDIHGKCSPAIVTDSMVLAYLQNSKLSAEISPAENGVCVEIFKLD